MKSSTTIKEMLAGNRIFVPVYQRAYSWDTELEKSNPQKHTNTFLSDLEDFKRSSSKARYYFGHFLFEEKNNSTFGVVDGQQRLTTIIIFLSAAYARLEQIRPLSEIENEDYEDMIKRNSTYRFDTVDYDKQFFRDYVIDQVKTNDNGLETSSSKRIIHAFDFFSSQLKRKDEEYILNMIEIIKNASCTTHPVKNESEAIQMFIFQNSRGKRPSNLEIVKAQFMFNVHLYGGEEKDSLIDEIKHRFEKIYKSISSIETKINEDDILVYTLRVYFNSLWEDNSIDKINKILSEANPINFIKLFTHSLATSFENLTTFYVKDEAEHFGIHSFISLGRIGVALPFIIKAYSFGIPKPQVVVLCRALESLVLRHRLIGTRADLTSRINETYQNFSLKNSSIEPICNHIESWIKNVGTDHWWWAYWNNEELERSLQGSINHSTAKYLLWRYENYLIEQGKGGYGTKRFDSIKFPELEHIAPQTENPESGYDSYNEEFKNQYLNCLGNYLLLSKPHNGWASNRPFKDKRKEYTQLLQQREIQDLTAGKEVWTKKHIQTRKDKIIGFVLENF